MVSSRDGRHGARERGADRDRAAATADELEEVRVRYLGRKSELKLALREVRDRETGMTLNAARERSRRRCRAARDASSPPTSPRTSTVRRHAPRRAGRRAARLHLITQIRRAVEDIFLGLGYEVVDDREVETVQYNFDALAFPEAHPSRARRATRSSSTTNTVLRTETSPSQIHAMEAREPPLYMVSIGRVYRRDTIDATHYADLPPVRGPRRRPRHHARRPEGHAAARLPRALRRGAARCGSARTSSRSPSRRWSRTSRARSAAARAAARASTPAGSRWAAPAMVDPAVFENVGYDPEEWSGFAFGLGTRADRAAAPRHPRPPPVLGERPPRPEAVLMSVPSPGCATTSRSTARWRSSPTGSRHERPR